MKDGYVFAVSAKDGKQVLGYAKTQSGPQGRAGQFDIYGLPSYGEALLIGFHPDRPWNMAIKEVTLTGRYQDERGIITQAPVTAGSAPGGDGASPLALLAIAGWIAESKLAVDQERESHRMADMLMRHVSDKAPNHTAASSVNYATLKSGARASSDSVGTYRGDSHPASGAIDGDDTTDWCNSWNMPGWLTVKFREQYTVRSVSVTWGRGAHNQRFSIALSNDGKNWETVVAERDSATDAGTHPKYHGNTKVRHEVFRIRPRQAWYMKVEVTKTSAPSSHIFKAIIHEVGAYGGTAKAVDSTPERIGTRPQATVSSKSERRKELADNVTHWDIRPGRIPYINPISNSADMSKDETEELKDFLEGRWRVKNLEDLNRHSGHKNRLRGLELHFSQGRVSPYVDYASRPDRRGDPIILTGFRKTTAAGIFDLDASSGKHWLNLQIKGKDKLRYLGSLMGYLPLNIPMNLERVDETQNSRR